MTLAEIAHRLGRMALEDASALMKNDLLFGRCAKQNVTHLMTYASHSHGRVGAHHPRRRRAQLRTSVAKP